MTLADFISKVLAYLNRLSDLFFAMSRYILKTTQQEEKYWDGKAKIS
jgi:cob(I)alamin adenosyltransferase